MSCVLQSILLLTLVSVVASITVPLPKPSGPYGVASNTAKLVDLSRLDPFAPVQQPRAVMISVFYPVESSSCTYSLRSYLPPRTAAFEDQHFASFGIPNGTFESLAVQSCNTSPLAPFYDQRKRHHVVLFSPALATTRLFYSAIAQSLASFGYVVVTIDHPYDADIVEFPDGSFVLGTINGDDTAVGANSTISLDVTTRSQDAIFVLNELGKNSVAKSVLPGAVRGLNTRRVGMFGHSLGGATTSATMAKDRRVIAGMNLDGSFFGPGAIVNDLSRPFLLFGRGGPPAHNRSSDDTWAVFWQHLSGWKTELSLRGAQHYTFSDLPVLVDVLGFQGLLPDAVTDMIGTLDGLRVLEILHVYIAAFFDAFLLGKGTGFVSGPSDSFPEVEFLD